MPGAVLVSCTCYQHLEVKISKQRLNFKYISEYVQLYHKLLQLLS